MKLESTTPMPRFPGDAEIRTQALIREKHNEYCRKAMLYKVLFYALRLCVGLSAAVIPFILEIPVLVKALSIAISVATVIDLIFRPGSNHKHYAMAANKIAMLRLKRTGEMQGYEEVIGALLATEAESLEHEEIDMKEFVKGAKEGAKA